MTRFRPGNFVSRYFALVPAAGFGARMGGTLPKQYLPLLDHSLLYHSVRPLIEAPFISRVFLLLAPTDERYRREDWRALGARLTALHCGGETRAASVLNGLRAVGGEVTADDWMLVHDAARPCLGAELLHRLKEEVDEDAVGGLLALPVADTLKRGDAGGRVLQTESRADLWQAQTPQMFRYQLLLEALTDAGTAADVTDEASALEQLGYRPKLVMGDSRNLKVTYPQDLALAELILRAAARP
jgi:2-C-methyl-D-erythritol 4-phosphate cytidylyltransferase